MLKSLRILAVALCACGLSQPSSGQVLTPGVGLATFETRAHGSDLVTLDVVYPCDATGSAVGTHRPAVVFVHGGFVDPASYRWQAERLASEGYVVAMPHHLMELAFFDVENGEAARELLTNPPASLLTGLVDGSRIAVAGHSLGGVVAAKLALEGRFHALVFEASFPDGADVAKLPGLSIPSLSLAGVDDCSAKLENVEKGWAELPSPTVLVKLSGVTHYQFTSDQTPDEKRGCAPELSLDEAHARIGNALSRFFAKSLHGQVPSTEDFETLVGAEVISR